MTNGLNAVIGDELSQKKHLLNMRERKDYTANRAARESLVTSKAREGGLINQACLILLLFTRAG